ncbi:MAG TPA: DUF1295 domain-containing protein [Bacteroidaceae bacterium]|nr:DUF1295 domain-containing protein [Bacteroidaceae bacterium]
MRIKKSISLIIIATVYVIALLSAYVFIHLSPGRSIFLNALYADLLATGIVFLFSIIFNNSSIYDPYWSVVPFFILMYWIFSAGTGFTAPVILLLIVMILWGTRLTINWSRDWEGMDHEDWRYKKFRTKFGRLYWLVSLGGIHLFPTAIVFLGMVPVYYFVTAAPTTINGLYLIGFAIAMGGTVIELTSDEQLKSFKKEPGKQGETIFSGLWKYSRHPNYLGEIMFWIGMWFFGWGAGNIYFWTIIAPISMILMFLSVSIPWMERKILATRPQYQSYMDDVPSLLPIKFRKRK